MAVPYGDPNPAFARKCAFDVGDYGLGYCANSLELGCDCLGYIHYFGRLLLLHLMPIMLTKAMAMMISEASLLMILMMLIPMVADKAMTESLMRDGIMMLLTI